MKEEITMKSLDVNDVEPEDIIRQAREQEARAREQEAKAKEGTADRKETLMDAVIQLLMEIQEGEDRRLEKEKKDNLVSACLFGVAAGSVVACMLYGLVEPIFAVPLAVVYCMRSAVRYDRWSRGGN